MKRDEAASAVAKRLGFNEIHGWQSKLNSDVWDALIDSELRNAELESGHRMDMARLEVTVQDRKASELRIQELSEALENLCLEVESMESFDGRVSSEAWEAKVKAEALLSEEKK